MRISDWRSYVCSSDLRPSPFGATTLFDRTMGGVGCSPCRLNIAGSAVEFGRVAAGVQVGRSPGPPDGADENAEPFPPCRHCLCRAGGADLNSEHEIARAHVLTPDTNAHLVCSLLIEK